MYVMYVMHVMYAMHVLYVRHVSEVMYVMHVLYVRPCHYISDPVAGRFSLRDNNSMSAFLEREALGTR